MTATYTPAGKLAVGDTVVERGGVEFVVTAAVRSASGKSVALTLAPIPERAAFLLCPPAATTRTFRVGAELLTGYAA